MIEKSWKFHTVHWVEITESVWKFNNFSATQILREIKFGNFTFPEIYHFNTFRGSEFWFFNDFCTYGRLIFNKLTKFRDSKMAKTAFLELLDSPKLISREMWMTEKSKIFHTAKAIFSLKKYYLNSYFDEIFLRCIFFILPHCVIITQCVNFRIFLPLRFYAKLKLANMEPQKLPF